MSGPWEDFQQEDATRLPAPPLADPNTDPAPWEEYAGAEAGGETGEPTPPAVSRDPEQIRLGLSRLVNGRAPREEINQFLAETGMTLDPETAKYMDEHYDAWRETTGGHWQVNSPEEREDISAWESAWAGLQSGALRGWDDEWKGFWGATGNKLGTALGLNESTADFWDIYETLQEENEAYKNEAYEQNTLAYGAGFIPGMFTGPTVGRVANAESKRDKVREAAQMGFIEGAISGAGNADEGTRIQGGVTGGAIGGALAPTLLPVQHYGGRAVSRLWERFGPRGGQAAAEGADNALNSGLDALVRRAPQNADDMTARAAELEAAGVQPRLVDVVDESGRGVIRDAGSKMTPARDDLVQAADSVYFSAQDRVAQQARDTISSAPNSARTIAADISRQQTELGPQFDSVRDLPVDLTPELIQVFGSVQGRTALGTVAKYMTAQEQQALRAFSRAVQQSNGLDPALPPAVRDQIMRQLMEGNPLTVDIADKFARIVRKLGRDEGMARPANEMADIVRGAARRQHPAYDEALVSFERLATVGDAARGTGKFEGDDFLRAAPDDYARVRANAENDTITIGQGDSATTYPSEVEISRVRARDDVVDRATSGSGAQAVATAKQIAQGSAQQQRNRVLLGEEGAERLEAGMRGEIDRVANTRYIDPRTGSQTASRQADAGAEGADDLMEATMHGAMGNKYGVVHSVRTFFRKAGIRGIDAERLTRDAISEDPARVQEAIAYMTQRGLERDRAQSMVRAIQSAMAGRAAGAIAGDKQARKPAHSIRAVLKEHNR